MAGMEELLKLLVYTQGSLAHILYRIFGPAYIDFIVASVTVELDPGESTTIKYTVPLDKVKIPSYMKYTFEAQRKFDIFWVRDGKVFMDVSSTVDWEMVPPYGYESWYPIKNFYSVKFTNNDVAARSATFQASAYLIDKNLFDIISEEHKKGVEALGLKI